MFRSFYGLAPLRTSSGFPCQAVYGFFKTLKRLCAKYAPTKILLAWDSQKNLRRDIFAAYKANRQIFPDELAVQRKKIIEIASIMGLPQLELDGYEADDIIFTATQSFSSNQIIIVSSDKDLLQLVDERINQLDPAKDLLIDAEEVVKIFGFNAEKIGFYHALLGDASDNIPGAKGIGKKTALELVTNFANLATLYENLSTVKPKIAQLLTASRDNVLLSEQLFTLQHCDLNLTLDKISFNTRDFTKANNLFAELEFKSLIEPPVGGQASLFAAQKSVADYSWLKFEIIKTVEQLNVVLGEARRLGVLAIDLETTGLNFISSQIVGISLAYTEEKSYYIPMAHENVDFEQLKLSLVLDLLQPLFNDNKVLKVLQNAKFDLHFLSMQGYRIPPAQIFDTMIAARLVRPEWQKVDLSTLSRDYLKIETVDYKDLFSSYQNFGLAPLELAAPYAASDALCTLRLRNIFELMLKEQNLYDLFINIETPVISVILEMEESGISLDLEKMAEITKKVEEQQQALEAKIRASFEGLGVKKFQEINLLSPKQIEQVLFDELKLEPVLKRKGGSRSTNKDSLEELARTHYLPGMILEYRKFAKLKNTYIDALPAEVNPKTEKIHTSYLQARVSTGRLASIDPNLQNVPPQIREAFVPSLGKIFVSADYSQIELRVLAHLSEDAALIAAFNAGRDVHQETAAQIFNCETSLVTHEQRQIGKKINFSVIYGLSAFSLARELGLSRSTAQLYIDAFFARYHGVALWMQQVVVRTKQLGFAQTLFGRRRFFPEINDRNVMISQGAQRAAINSIVQGTASEILKIAMVKLAEKLNNKLSAKIILQVHDELLLECVPENAKILEIILKETMSSAVKLLIPLEVSVKKGTNWAFVEK